MTKACRLVWTVALAAAGAAHAAPVEIHPAGPTVPENLLRLELRFERPPPLPFDTGRLTLLDGDGRALPHALLDVAVPDADGRRITVLMDPGRVKTGVGPNRDAGRALTAGSSVSLKLTDGAAAPVLKTWRVTAAATAPLRPEAWVLTPPRRGSRDALTVDLQVPISSVGEALIAVVDAQGRRVPGTAVLADGDAQWRFTPARRWAAGAHRLVTHPELEDPAGNRRCAPFESALQHATRCEGASLPFTPRNPS